MQQPPNQEYPQKYVLDNVPFEERRVIDELVEFWQTRYAPRDLITHIDRLSGSWGSGIGASFFRQVFEDMCTDKRNKYAASSAYEFRRFLEAEYRRLYHAYTERQAAQAKAEVERQVKEREEREMRARADFDALGNEMAKATTRAELVELGRKRVDLAPYTGNSYVYKNHCWYDRHPISSDIHARCPYCGWYICSTCSSCSPLCDKTYHPFNYEVVDPFLPDYPDDIS